MSQQPELHPISLHYQVRTSKQGCQEVERLLPLLGELQNAGITDLRQHDPDFANISRRLAASVVKRVNDAYHRPYTVPNAGFPRTESPTVSGHWKSPSQRTSTSSSEDESRKG